MKWAHLDIAGVAYQGGANKGSTGRPTALLADSPIHRAGRMTEQTGSPQSPGGLEGGVGSAPAGAG